MSKLKFSVERKNLSEQIADYLEEYILSKESNLGDKLQSEQALADTYQVSRPVIREAFKLLMERGLIIQKNGDGAYISKPDNENIYKTVKRIITLEKIKVEEFHQIRIILEVEAARSAATNATDDDFEELGSIIKTMETNDSLSLMERVKLDIDFHNVVARASGNTLLDMFVNVMTSLSTNYMAKGAIIEGGIDDANERHMIILEALKTRDGKNAASAMFEHLQKSKLSVEQYNNNKFE